MWAHSYMYGTSSSSGKNDYRCYIPSLIADCDVYFIIFELDSFGCKTIVSIGKFYELYFDV